jgi:hypothetical protein
MSDTEAKNNNELLDWYNECAGMAGMGYAPDEYRGNDQRPPVHHQEPDYNVQTVVVKPEEEKKEEPAKKIEDLGEMYKALSTARMIEGKLVSYSTKESDEDKGKIKSDIKALVKKLGEIANGL